MDAKKRRRKKFTTHTSLIIMYRLFPSRPPIDVGFIYFGFSSLGQHTTRSLISSIPHSDSVVILLLIFPFLFLPMRQCFFLFFSFSSAFHAVNLLCSLFTYPSIVQVLFFNHVQSIFFSFVCVFVLVTLLNPFGIFA